MWAFSLEDDFAAVDVTTRHQQFAETNFSKTVAYILPVLIHSSKSM